METDIFREQSSEEDQLTSLDLVVNEMYENIKALGEMRLRIDTILVKLRGMDETLYDSNPQKEPVSILDHFDIIQSDLGREMRFILNGIKELERLI